MSSLVHLAVAVIILLAAGALAFRPQNGHRSRQHVVLFSDMDGGGFGSNEPRVERSKIPSRKDTCRLFVSGVVGTEPKETFLSNGHYVLNFALAVVGHFQPQHDWETYKPTETMWLSSELWDDTARDHQRNVRKGAPLSGVGYLISNKWTDKTTGEEKKTFKLRITNVLSEQELNDMLGSSGALDMMEMEGSDEGMQEARLDSGFSNMQPRYDDQLSPEEQDNNGGGFGNGRGGGGGGGGRAPQPPPTRVMGNPFQQQSPPSNGNNNNNNNRAGSRDYNRIPF